MTRPRKNGAGRRPAVWAICPVANAARATATYPEASLSPSASPRRRRTDEIDLHQDGGRPGQPLVHAEEDVGRDHPGPVRCQDQDDRDRQPDEPTGHEDGFAPKPVGECSGDQVRERLRDTKRDEKRERAPGRGEAKDLIREQRHDGPLLADHPADQCVDPDEQGERAGIGSKAKGECSTSGLGHEPEASTPAPRPAPC